jgi:predicted RNA methylase
MPPTIRNRIYIFGRAVKTRGIQAAFDYYLSRLNVRLRKRRNSQVGPSPNNLDHSSRLSTPPDLRIRSAHAKWGVRYFPTREDIFRKAFTNLPIRFEDYIFIDLGCGKGQVVLWAAKYPFKRVVGVEYSETLAAAATANVQAATDLVCECVECICADATQFDFPSDDAVVYLYNPFQGRVMDQVVRNIEQALQTSPRDLWIVYINPWEHRKFVRSRYLRTIVENWDVPGGWEFCIYRSVHLK